MLRAIATHPALHTFAAQPAPEIGKVVAPRVVGGDRAGRHALVAEDHIAVQVAMARSIGVLVADEGGEATGGAAIVVIFGGLLDLLPEVGVPSFWPPAGGRASRASTIRATTT